MKKETKYTARLNNGTLVGVEVLNREPSTWFSKERVLISYKSIIVDNEVKEQYSNIKTQWVSVDNLFPIK